MQDLTAYMKETEIERFSTNDYRGRPDAPPFFITAGTLPVLISAPHAVSQLRDGRVKPSDDFTGAMALAMANLAGCFAIVASRYDACDPNWDPYERCAYKQALVRTVCENGIVAVLDIHGVPAASPYAIEIGSADGQTVRAHPGTDEYACRLLRERLETHLADQGKTIALNKRHAARNHDTVTRTVSRECGIIALQVEISTPFRVPCVIHGHTPAGEAIPFSADQIPLELASRRNPDSTCVETTVHALVDLSIALARIAESEGL